MSFARLHDPNSGSADSGKCKGPRPSLEMHFKLGCSGRGNRWLANARAGSHPVARCEDRVMLKCPLAIRVQIAGGPHSRPFGAGVSAGAITPH